MNKKYNKKSAGTFALNKKEAIHNWYSYIEGYSSCLIEDILSSIEEEQIKTIYDPFCGTGTTSLVAASKGIKSYYSETNPFMRMVIEAKINSIINLRKSNTNSKYLKQLLNKIKKYEQKLIYEPIQWGGFEKYFDNDVLAIILDIKKMISKMKDKDSKNIATVLLGSIMVKSSNTVRQGDLRFAKGNEKKPEDKDVILNYINKLETAIAEIDNKENVIKTKTKKLADDARDISIENKIDCVITSPPYLNGTNYIRNTKLELKLTDFLVTENDVTEYHSKGIVAGINNVSKRKQYEKPLEIVQPYIDSLDKVSYDKRIQIMVSQYFIDMKNVIKKLSVAIKENGYFIMDIGDSQFAGVHIPTHDILKAICEENGFKLYDEEILRERRSKDGTKLSQRLLKFKLESKNNNFRAQAQKFHKNMPYKQEPYSGRNWGHQWHSLCSYHGKLKPAIAHFLIKDFTKPGDIVVDPLCGVGTIPFEACLQGRIGIGNDLSEMAYCVTKAKLNKPTYKSCLQELNKLSDYINNNVNSKENITNVKKNKDFGFNGSISSYYHPETLKELICAKTYFIKKTTNMLPQEAMIFSCLLHVLHGNRPYALSRNSHPLTPYAPTGEYIYKNVIEHIKNKLDITYKKEKFEEYLPGEAIYGDYYDLDKKIKDVDFVICSPPFADSMRFYMQNWLRLWFCGWEKEWFKEADEKFIDQKQKNDFDIYNSFFEICNKILKPNGKIILHLGKTKEIDMAEELSKRSAKYFDEVYRFTENVEKIEKHGIKDKGATIEHQYLFLQKK